MNTEELFLIMDKFESSTLAELTVEDNETMIAMKKNIEQNIIVPQTVQAQTEPVEVKKEIEAFTGTLIKAPLVGTFYRASSPEAKPYVNVGDQVKKGDVVALIEAMKLMNEIVAPVDGVIDEILIENEELVQFDQVLIKMKE
jgi:acetyl-CoA carboxylase biotin carboxyl carrier protein